MCASRRTTQRARADVAEGRALPRRTRGGLNLSVMSAGPSAHTQSNTRCHDNILPTFILAGQSNMLGYMTDWNTLPEKYRNVTWRQSVRRFGFHSDARCEVGWGDYTLGSAQHCLCGGRQQFCAAGRNGTSTRNAIHCNLDPRHRFTSAQRCTTHGPGPEAGFARGMAQMPEFHALMRRHFCSRGLGLLKAARTSSTMRDWMPESEKGAAGELWSPFESLLRAAVNSSASDPETGRVLRVRVLGLVWLQGEAEQQGGNVTWARPRAERWGALFGTFVARVRQILGAPRLAVVLGRSLPAPPYWNGYSWRVSPGRMDENSRIVREQQTRVGSSLNFTKLVDLDSISDKINRGAPMVQWRHVAHLDTRGVLRAGEKFAQAMLEVLPLTL